MIVDRTDGYLAKVLSSEPAQRINGHQSLAERLYYLGTYADHANDGRTRCILYPDFAPLSFMFNMERRQSSDEDYQHWFNGGLIFHGDHDGGGNGGAPTYSVNLNPVDGWSIHT